MLPSRSLGVVLVLSGFLSAVVPGAVFRPAKPAATSPVSIKKLNWHWTCLDKYMGAALVPGLYRSYGSLFIDFSESGELVLWEADESGLYRDLLARSVRPRLGLVEITTYPLTFLAARLERDHPDFYDRFTVSEDLNLIRSLGAGIQEPWSLSLFAGQQAVFWDLDSTYRLVPAATGASGGVLTIGNVQLFNNSLVPSRWVRLEWKLKGEGRAGNGKQRWDIKLGYRWYGIPAVANSITLSLTRIRITRRAWDWTLTRNSQAKIELQLPPAELKDGLSRVVLEGGKFIPCRKIMLGLKLGALYENRRAYDPREKAFETGKVRRWEVYIQPVVIL